MAILPLSKRNFRDRTELPGILSVKMGLEFRPSETERATPFVPLKKTG